MKDFYNKKVEYFWEYNYPFGEIFLKGIFKNEYKKLYSLKGDGIFYLIISADGKVYQIDFKKSSKMLEADGKKAFRDEYKDIIIEKIANQLKHDNINFTINSGKFITFELGSFIAKIEIVKKNKMPE